VLFWLGVAVFAASIAAGLFRSFAMHRWLPPIGVEYTTELEALVREHGGAAVLPQIRSAAKIDFDNEAAVTRLLQTARQAGAADEALWALVALARLKPEDPLVRTDLATELLRHGRADEALKQAAFAAWLAPDSCEVHCCLGHVFAARGQREEAAAAYRYALQLDPTSEAAQTALSLSLSGY
jgi:Flp pilus assembly protein TadD